MTGWGRGGCRGTGRPRGGGGYRGLAHGGGGRGWRHRFWATPHPGWMSDDMGFNEASERRWLEQRAAELDDQRRRIESRLEALASSETD